MSNDVSLLREVLQVFGSDWNEEIVDGEWAKRANELVKRLEARVAAEPPVWPDISTVDQAQEWAAKNGLTLSVRSSAEPQDALREVVTAELIANTKIIDAR
jgi:alkanesulfonate monooxygenase SsuD/methylene tetrahydromethanopterin reductase-like flavin-dependent oxidoreductase (luciferase family)